MLLVFPSIELSHGRCLNLVQGEPGSEKVYSVDPVKMAVLWRGENAKTLHVIDVDGIARGSVHHKDVIRQMVEAVDIPIQVCGGLRSYDEVKSVLELGVYRVVIGTAAVENPALIEQLIKEFGSRKVAIALESKNLQLMIQGGKTVTGLSPVEFTLEMKRRGVSRVLYSEVGELTSTNQHYFDALKELASKTNVRVTAWGGVASYKDLLRLQELERFGVDSVIIGKPLYENQFPCQYIWRMNEKELKDLGPTRRI